MKKVCFKILSVIMSLVIVFLSVHTLNFISAFAKETNGAKAVAGTTRRIKYCANGIVSNSKKIKKKLKKNAWSSTPNPESPEITQGFAMYKIYNALVATGFLDSEEYGEYVDSEISVSEAGYSGIIASNKTQKKAIKWMLTHNAYMTYNFDRYDNKVFDGKRKIKRYELACMLQSVIGYFFPMMIEDVDTGTSWLKSDDLSSDSYDGRIPNLPMYKGIIVGENLDLDGYATKEDLNRALKNFKIVVSHRIPFVFRDEEVEVTDELLKAEEKELIEFLESYGAQLKDYGFYTRIFMDNIDTESYFRIDDWTEEGYGKVWEIAIGFNNNWHDKSRFLVRGRKIDLVATIKKVFEIRY